MEVDLISLFLFSLFIFLMAFLAGSVFMVRLTCYYIEKKGFVPKYLNELGLRKSEPISKREGR